MTITGPAPQDESIGSGPLRVLVVDDNAINQRVAGLTFRRLGFPVDLVHSGEEALERATEKDYDVIFMDLQMPGMDGFEATRKIRAVKDDDRQPHIIGLSAHLGDEVERKSREAGMDDYISKPLRVDSLRALLDKLQP